MGKSKSWCYYLQLLAVAEVNLISREPAPITCQFLRGPANIPQAIRLASLLICQLQSTTLTRLSFLSSIEYASFFVLKRSKSLKLSWWRSCFIRRCRILTSSPAKSRHLTVSAPSLHRTSFITAIVLDGIQTAILFIMQRHQRVEQFLSQPTAQKQASGWRLRFRPTKAHHLVTSASSIRPYWWFDSIRLQHYYSPSLPTSSQWLLLKVPIPSHSIMLRCIANVRKLSGISGDEWLQVSWHRHIVCHGKWVYTYSPFIMDLRL